MNVFQISFGKRGNLLFNGKEFGQCVCKFLWVNTAQKGRQQQFSISFSFLFEHICNILTGKQVDVDLLTPSPKRRDLQDSRAAQSPMGKKDVLFKRNTIIADFAKNTVTR